jgi:putative membrane-bound dehydrogenase-like protein
VRPAVVVVVVLGVALPAAVLRHARGAAPSPPAIEQDHRNPLLLRDAAGERPVRTADEWAMRRAGILEGMQAAMGRLPDRSRLPALDVKVTAEVKGEGFTRQTITFVAEGAERVPAHLYLPTSRRPPDTRGPAMLALHQTSDKGKLDLAGEGPNPNMGYAPELARRGYVVLCPDYPSFGEYAGYDFAADKYESGSMKGIFNHMRAVDLLQARDDVDPHRVGAIGHSLGGHNAIFLAVFDERVKVAVSSCGWTALHDYYGGKLDGWTSDRYVPRIRDVYGLDPDRVPFDMPELIAAIAPRAFLSISPVRDDNFAVEGVKKGIAAAAPVFELLGAKDALHVRYPDCAHDFPPPERETAFAFIDKALQVIPPAGPKAAAPDETGDDFAAELPRIPPREPAEALRAFQTLPGFRIELAAAEPNVASPVALSFDERGRMFVCEMRDYSEQDKDRLGRVRMLEDLDDDGIFEKSTVYADDLSWPTAVLCVGGGVYVGAAPDILWLKDTDGDGRADERTVIFTGFGRSNVQGLLNSFHWGLDNRVHGATSTSGGQVRRPEQPEAEAINLGGRDFSFDPQALEIRAESGGGQHGMSFDDWGRKFVSANSDHIQMVMVPDRYLAADPHLTLPSARESIAADGPQAEVFRISPVEPWRVVRTRLRTSGAVPGIVEGGGRAAGYFTGATGVTIYRGDAFPPEYRGQAFVGDVGSNIIHRKVLEPNGVGLIARRIDEGREFVASHDIWFRPAQFANAPDGALYVIDVCREVIEHPASLPPVIKRHLDLTSGRDRGRIWRIVPDGFRRRPAPRLDAATTAELVANLGHRNGWHRDTAARLLFERRDPAAIPLLETLATSSNMPEARVHAMYALHGLRGLSEAVLDRGLADASPHVREHAVSLLATSVTYLSSTHTIREWNRKLTPLAADADPRVRFQVALCYSTPDSPDAPVVIDTLLRNAGDDRWLRAAALSKGARDPVRSLETLLAKPDDPFATSDRGRVVVTALVRTMGARNDPAQVTAALQTATNHPRLAADVLGALSEGLASAGASLRDRLEREPEARATFDRLLDDARKVAADPDADVPARVTALRLLATDSLATGRATFAAALSGNAPQDVQLAALAALDRFADPAVGPMLTMAWPGMTPAVRTAAGNVIFARPERAVAYLDAVEAGTIRAADVDRARLKTLESGDDAALRDRAAKLLASGAAAGRQEVFESYRPALSLAGDAARGRAVFERTCAACHRADDVGREIGPNLAAMKSRGAEAVLLNVIDPNREVNPQFVEYVVQTKAGRTTSGMLASETAGGITLKRAGGETETVSRTDVKRMRSSGLSLMPEGLEQGIDRQGMADLIAYVMSAK